MTEKKGIKLNLAQLDVDVFDTDPLSKMYFRISGFPDRLCLGKNSFTIHANDNTLAVGAELYIEFLDSNGDPLYYEALDYINLDKSRTIVVYVYPSTPPGEFYAYIASRSSYKYSENRNLPNVLWYGTGIIVPNKPTTSPIEFTEEPVVSFTEKIVPYSIPTTATGRHVTAVYIAADPTVTFFANSTSPPSQYLNSKIENTAKFEAVNRVYLDPGSGSVYGQSATLLNLPTRGYTVVSASGIRFNDDMVGSSIVFNNVDITRSLPGNISSPIPTISYSGSIVEVRSTGVAVVYPPFSHTLEYRDHSGNASSIVLSKFERGDQSTASIAYYVSQAQTQSNLNQSLLALEFSNLSPAAGTVKQVRLKYKPIGSPGEYVDYSTFDIVPQNLLVDTGSYISTKTDGIIEQPIGKFTSTSVFNTYWTVEDPYSKATGVAIGHNIFESIKLTAALANTRQFTAVTNIVPWQVKANTEYDLTFNSAVPNPGNKPLLDQIDVYISGSVIIADSIARDRVGDLLLHTESPTAAVHNGYFGTYLGSVMMSPEQVKMNTFSFKTGGAGRINVKLVLRSLVHTISNIRISPAGGVGFTPNHHRLIVPLTKTKRNTEYSFKVEYISPNGEASRSPASLYGLKFDGGNTVIDGSDNILSGSFSGDGTGIKFGDTFYVGAASPFVYYDSGSDSMQKSGLLRVAEDTHSLMLGYDPSYANSPRFPNVSVYTNISGSPNAGFDIFDENYGVVFSISGSDAGVFFPNIRADIATKQLGLTDSNELVLPASDIRLKTNIRDLEDVLASVNNLRPVRFNPIDGTVEKIGLIAQELEVEFPEFVGENRGYKFINYSELVSILIKSVQELSAEVGELRKKL